MKYVHTPEYQHTIPNDSRNCNHCLEVATSMQDMPDHIEQTHTQIPCSYCEFLAQSDDQLKDHVYSSHEEAAIFINMAKQIDDLTDSVENLTDLRKVVHAICDTQNAMKQELFLIRNQYQKAMRLDLSNV